MNRDDIIRMAREAGFDKNSLGWTFTHGKLGESLEAFAALVAAAERERLKWDGIHSCHPECDRPACVNTRKAVKAEREECAKVCMSQPINLKARQMFAAAIRARGNNG